MKKISPVLITVLCMFFFQTAEGKKNVEKNPEPTTGSMGMVSSAHPLATRAGLGILKQGGNAFDAAIAMAATLNVVEPMMSGIGGYGTILIYDAKKREIRYLDSSGKIPRHLNSDVFRKPHPQWQANRRGAKAISTPGNLNAWEAMSEVYGELKWRDLFSDAIQIAEGGFILDKFTADWINHSFKSFPGGAKIFYGKNNRPLGKGERLVQKDLAGTFKKIAIEGAKVFYRGKIGKTIVSEISKMNGFLCMEDLKTDKAEWWKPIFIDYRGCRVYTASPPSTAFPSLIRLGLMSRFDITEMGHNTANTLHRFIESTKHAFWCRLKYAGDPEVSPPPLDMLLSRKYWGIITKEYNTQKARPFVYPGNDIPENRHTTHFVVADRWGNVVSATQTLGNLFGSRIMPEGTGIWLNNSLAYCTFEPKGNPMDAHAGRRKLSGDCPTIIVKNGKPWVAIGTPGGHTIGQTVPQMVMNIIDFGMTIQKAISVPRVSFIEPQTITVERGISEKVIRQLRLMGHHIKVRPKGLGNAHGLMIEYGKNNRPVLFKGASDPRGNGLALGLNE